MARVTRSNRGKPAEATSEPPEMPPVADTEAGDEPASERNAWVLTAPGVEFSKSRFDLMPQFIFEMGLSAGAIAVWLYLHRCAGDNRKAFPSQTTIGKALGGMTPKTVRAKLEELEAADMVSSHWGGSAKTKSYVLSVPRQFENDLTPEYRAKLTKPRGPSPLPQSGVNTSKAQPKPLDKWELLEREWDQENGYESRPELLGR